ncbi:adenylate/guanylate cyclase domain-containing protein [Mesorhizobium sp.]|uniref:adenylate/guanylate cyclase domain-containing protein n=1 Tax=Mesorhizobium sp. TaxID=1871066 RepID=UPI0011FCC024|nr:adenylate/guanylate cyclase domain-containing protein [Mesorhizobium sp.]TIL69560.1 MAG: adenylate/guanylate cyclase domain-containing protein [Mesorhizobium sp.]
MAADIVGYSRLMETDEAATLAAIKALRAEVIDPLLNEHNGRVVKLMGDGALVEFHSVVDAVACAVAIQTRVAAHQSEAPAGRRIVFRIGINLGDVVVEGDDLFGDGVNVAARLEQLCQPGGVLISGTAYDHMKGKLSLPIDFAGAQKVKNIAEPVRTYSVRMRGAKRGWSLRTRRIRRFLPMAAASLVLLAFAAAGAWWGLRPVDTAIGKPSIAVLPFSNYGGDEATRRLADGLTEDIITDLARFPEFQVVARNSTEAYKGKPVDVRQVAAALYVGYVLEGSIQRQGSRVRINAQLIEAASGKHLWSERWDRPDEDVFAVQTEISEQVTNRLGGGEGLIQGAGRAAAKRKRPENLNAYEFYLLGTEKLAQINKADIEEAIRLLTRAVELDPGLARAWVELYHSHSLLASFGVSPESERKAAVEAAERAVRLDPSDAEAHAALGMSFGERGDLARAKVELDTALRMAPSSAEILTFYIGWAPTFGEPERGVELVDQVIRLDPNYPLWATNFFSYAYFMAGRYEDALKMQARMTPETYNLRKWSMRCGSFAALGRTEDTKACVAEALKRFPDLTMETMANEPGYSDAEHQRFLETMRKAGFPVCASPEALAKFAKPQRLPECEKGTAN